MNVYEFTQKLLEAKRFISPKIHKEAWDLTSGGYDMPETGVACRLPFNYDLETVYGILSHEEPDPEFRKWLNEFLKSLKESGVWE